jgi:mediator of RNA polymerase II transcription subunit 13
MARVPSSSSSSTKTPSLFIDVSSTTYAIFPKRNLSLSLPPTPADLGLSLSFVPESGCSSPTTATPSPAPEDASPLSSTSGTSYTPEYPHPLPLRPLSTTLLVRVPAASIASTPSILHINLLAAFPYDAETNVGQLHADITQSYHDLAVLSAARWKLAQMGADPILPFHLAAVDAMRAALERDGASL